MRFLTPSLAFLMLLASAHAETVDGRRIIIIDGDTVGLPGGEHVRLLDIDAPETRNARCEAELVIGLRSKERLAQLLRPGAIDIERRGTDRYGRTLAHIKAGGQDVGAILIKEGLAVPYKPGHAAWEWRAAYWCGSRAELKAR